MSEQVRLGRKEAKRDRTARENQTRQMHKHASRVRHRESSSADFAFVLDRIGLPDIADIDALIDELIRDYRFGSLSERDYPTAIFDPRLEDLTRLPIGLLDEKEVALPSDLIPQSESELLGLCRRFIIRNQDDDVIAAVVGGLPGGDRSTSILERHAHELMRPAGQRPAVYREIVGGQHRSALMRLRGDMPPGFIREAIERLLIVHGLLWCANDLQLNLARAARAERNPLDRLVSSKFRQLQPERVANDLRPQLYLMRHLLDSYVTKAEAQGPDARTPLTTVPRDRVTWHYRRQVEGYAAEHGIDLLAMRDELDQIIPRLRELAHDRKDPFLALLTAMPGQGGLPKQFTGVWFSGLSTVQSAAVTILRYMQAEHEMVGTVRARMAMVFDGAGPPEDLAMPPFRRTSLPKGWQERAKTLLNLYRRELVDDKDLPLDPSKNAGMAAITNAAQWLEQRPQRRIEDHDERAGGDRRSMYLLDVILEARLAR